MRDSRAEALLVLPVGFIDVCSASLARGGVYRGSARVAWIVFYTFCALGFHSKRGSRRLIVRRRSLFLLASPSSLSEYFFLFPPSLSL